MAVVVLYDVGELHDPPGKSGLGHLVEHIYVTAATPSTPQRTAQQFMENYRKEIAGLVISQCNAQTGDDYTVLAGVVPPNRLEEEIKQAAQRMSQLKIEQSDLDREVPRMMEEIHNMFEGIRNWPFATRPANTCIRGQTEADTAGLPNRSKSSPWRMSGNIGAITTKPATRGS